MKVTRLVRPGATVIVTDDGYRYEWPEGGEAVDVLPQHQKALLATKGAKLVEVEVPDPPVVLPVFRLAETLTLATVEPPAPEPDADLTGAEVEPAEVPDPEPLALATVKPEQPEPAADLSDARIDPDTVTDAPAPSVTLATVSPDAPLDLSPKPRIGHRWSEDDMARLLSLLDERSG